MFIFCKPISVWVNVELLSRLDRRSVSVLPNIGRNTEGTSIMFNFKVFLPLRQQTKVFIVTFCLQEFQPAPLHPPAEQALLTGNSLSLSLFILLTVKSSLVQGWLCGSLGWEKDNLHDFPLHSPQVTFLHDFPWLTTTHPSQFRPGKRFFFLF